MADERNLTAGQQAIIDGLRRRGGNVTADTFAYMSFGRDIEDLSDEELQTIPDFLLEPWLQQQEQAE